MGRRLIDADALIELIDDDIASLDKNMSREGYDVCLCTLKIVKQYIKALPTVEAEPKHGRWINEPNCWYRCSVCGEHYPSSRGYMTYNYCPYCGARMDGGENDI